LGRTPFVRARFQILSSRFYSVFNVHFRSQWISNS